MCRGRVYWTKNDEGGAARQEHERKTSEKVDAVKKDRGLVGQRAAGECMHSLNAAAAKEESSCC